MIFVKTIEEHDKLSFETNFTIIESLLGDLVPKKVNFFCSHALIGAPFLPMEDIKMI